MSNNAGILHIAISFIAAVFVALLVGLATHFAGLFGGLSAHNTSDGAIAGYFVFGSMFGFPIALIFGVPLVLAFRRRGWLSWWQAAIGGGLAGGLGAFALHMLDTTTYLLGMFRLFSSLGAVAGLAFWIFILRKLRTNNSLQPTPLRGAAKLDR